MDRNDDDDDDHNGHDGHDGQTFLGIKKMGWKKNPGGQRKIILVGETTFLWGSKMF